MTVEHVSSVRKLGGPPLSVLVREEILRAILEKRFTKGRLPPEDTLAANLGVSRTTVRSALQALERDGLITRRRGIGTLVKPHVAPYRLGLHRLIGFSTLLEEWGHRPSVEIATRLVTRPKDEWVTRLKIARDAKCLLMEKLFRANGEPALAITDVVPVTSLVIVPGTRDEIPDPIFSFFELYGKQSINHAVVEIVPKNATQAVAARLEMRPGEAYLHLIEVHYNSANEPVASSYIGVNDRYVRFDVVRQHR
jgi:GntR family transcriptional regulator